MDVCKRCGRPLKSQKSIDDGYGPICKRKQAAEDAEREFLKRQLTIEQMGCEVA